MASFERPRMAFVRYVILVCAAIVLAVQGGGMMRRETPGSGLRAALEKVLAEDPAQRLFHVEEILRPTFEAFPKNTAGKIALKSLHSMARGYFAEEHGWLFKGFEFAGPRSTKLSDAKVLRENAPDLVVALEKAESLGEGLSLSDAVAALAVVEHFVLQESVSLLEQSYKLNEVSLTSSLKREALEELLQSYMLLFRTPKRYNTTHAHEHKSVIAESLKEGEFDAEELRAFYKVSVDSHGKQSDYTLQDASRIVKDMSLRYGKWQNSDCVAMKQALVSLDSDVTGRVPLDTFHAQPKNPKFAFTEPIEFLRNISSVDESHAAEPKVMIANYLASPSNCIGWSEYLSVCCLNECESLVNDLEAKVQTSDVPVQQLLDTVAGFSSSSISSVPRELPPRLKEIARSVAKVHGGVVPLQSGDFRRWIHFAFPNECPFPTDLEAQVAEGDRDASERWLGMQPVRPLGTEAHKAEDGQGTDL